MAGINALSGAPIGNLGGFRVTLDDELKRLIGLHGADTVREAIHRLTKKKVGRKQERDLFDLGDWFEQDAVDWLNGRNPLVLRANYAMAKHVADREKPHNRAATHRRIMRKLSAKRKSIMHILAWQRAHELRPFPDYFRAGEALVALDPKWEETVQWSADNVRGKIERYKSKYGEIDLTLTIPQIDEALNVPDLFSTTNGYAGLLSDFAR